MTIEKITESLTAAKGLWQHRRDGVGLMPEARELGEAVMLRRSRRQRPEVRRTGGLVRWTARARARTIETAALRSERDKREAPGRSRGERT